MKWIAMVIVGALLMAAGYHAADIVRTERVMVMNKDGNTVVDIGVDQAGGGFLVAFDQNGEQVFSVENGVVRLPQSAAQDPAQIAAGVTSEVIRLEAIKSKSTVDSEKLAQAARLTADANALEAQARARDHDSTQLTNKYSSDTEQGRLEEIRLGHERTRLRQLAIKLRRESRSKKGEVIRLEKSATVVTQELRGWNGQREVTLTTTRDLSTQLRAIGIGSFVSWTGQLIQADDIHEIWEVQRVELAQRPEGFGDRP